MTVYMPAPARYKTVRSALEHIYHGVYPGDYKTYIQEVGVRDAALSELYDWVRVERFGGFWRADASAYKNQSDAALYAMNQTEPYIIHEINEDDLIFQFRSFGWVSE